MTPAAIETAARNRLNAASSTFWSSTEVLSECLYSAMMEIATELLCIEGTPDSTVVSVASQAEYTKPSGVIGIRAMTYDGRPLEVMDKRTYDSMNMTLSVAAIGTPTHYYEWANKFTAYPTPDTSALVFKIWPYSEPAVPTAGSTLELPTWMHTGLIDGTAYYMSLKEVSNPKSPELFKSWLARKNHIHSVWRMKKRANKFGRVKREEDMLTSRTGII